MNHRSQRWVVKLTSYIVHFGEALGGIECDSGCATARFNKLAFLINGISNRLNGLPWYDEDWTSDDEELFNKQCENYPVTIFDRASTIACISVRGIGLWLNKLVEPDTVYISDGTDSN